MIEVPEEIVARASLSAGNSVEWFVYEDGSIGFVKKSISDGLLEIEDKIAEKERREKSLLDERKLAELGDVNAQSFLGSTLKDKVEAMRWLRLAAEQGDRFSMWYLGRLLVDGDGIKKNIAEGYFWLFLHVSTYSLKSGRRAEMNEKCRELRRIAKNLTEEERNRIEERGRNWLDAHKLTKCFKPKLS